MTIADEFGMFDAIDRSFGTGHAPLQSKRICSLVIFFASCTVLLFFGEAFICIRRLTSTSQKWAALQARFTRADAVTCEQDILFFKDAAEFMKCEQAQKNKDGKPSGGLDAALSRVCGKQLLTFIEVPWCDLLLCAIGAWVAYSIIVSLLGFQLDSIPADYDLLVESASIILLLWSIGVLLISRKRLLKLVRSGVLVQMCQFSTLIASFCLVYIIARLGNVVHVDILMHPNMESATYSFDTNGVWSYSLVLGYNLVVLVSILPRIMEALPFVGVFEGEVHEKSD